MNSLVRHMLYPAPAYPVPSPPPRPLTEVSLTVGHHQVIGWTHESAPESALETFPAVLYFHGNGENLATLDLAGLFDQLTGLKVHFLAVDYPGYGRSQGEPSELSLVAAGRAAHAWLAARYPLAPRFLLGWSLGAAVAVQVAKLEPSLAGLILLSAWDDLLSLAAAHIPPILLRGLRDHYDSHTAAARLNLPTLLLHGTEDRVIPIAHGRRLHQALGNASRFVPIAGAGHNDLLDFPEVWEEIRAFLQLVSSAQPDVSARHRSRLRR